MQHHQQQHALNLRPLGPEFKRLFSHIQHGDEEAVKRELQAGVAVNVVDPITTDSPLMLACRKGFTNIVKLCLDYGAKNDPHPDFGQTALHAAVASGHFSCAEVILKVAAESDADHIISNLTDQYGQTPLHCAALIGSVPLTELLLRHGAQISSVDSYGQTPLHLSAGAVNKACLAVLLDHGGDEVMEVPDVYGNRPLHHAVYHGRLECAKLLLETAADVTARNSKNLTPYNLASMQGHHQIGLLLLEYRDHHNIPPSVASTPNKLAFFTPSKGGPRQSYSPQQFELANASTPPTSRYEDREFRTPMTSNKYEIAVSINESSQNGFGPGSLSIGVPEFRRNQSNELAGLHLPRPHTVGSPSVNNKALSTKKKTSKAPSAVSSPTEGHRKNSESSWSDMNGSQQSFTSAMPQLSTPLFSRDVSNRTTSSHESYEREDAKIDYPTVPDDQIAYLSSGGYTPAKERHTSSNHSQDHYSYNQYDYADYVAESEPYDHHYDGYQSTSDAHTINNNATQNEEYLSTPKRKVDVELDSQQQESEFADPLEVFSWCDRVWYVYMTEQSDVYYLDMENNHSQWEDPRVHGVISMSSYYDLPPDSPSKLSDTAPPLSPALKSPTHSSPSVSLPGSAIKNDSELRRVARAFQKVFTFEDETNDRLGISSQDGTTPSSLLGLGIASMDRNRSTPENGSVISESSSDDEEVDISEVNVRNLATRNVRKNFMKKNQVQIELESKSIDSAGDSKEVHDDLRSDVVKTRKLFDSPDRAESKTQASSTESKSSDDDKERSAKKHSESKTDENNENVSESDEKKVNSRKSKPASNPKRDSWINQSDAKEERDRQNDCKEQPVHKINSIPKFETTIESNNSNHSAKQEKNYLNEVSVARTSEDSVVDLEECQRYVEMIHGGKSLYDVRLLLETDGRCAKFIKKVMALADDLVILDENHNHTIEDSFASPKPKDSTGSNGAKEQPEEKKAEDPAITLDSIKDDPVYSKYAKMAKMGVPPMSVITKMKMDNVDAAAITTMQQALGLAPPPSKNDEQSKKDTKWQPVPEDRLKNSIWAFSVAGRAEEPLLAEQELKELEQLFLAVPTPSISSNSEKSAPPKPSFTLKLLEGKRAQNITIGLVAFKCFGSHVDVIKGICSLRDFDGKLTADHLQNFKSLLPTESEVKKSFLLKNVNHPAEIFVQSALIFYPELPLRLDAFVICLNFTSFATELEKRMKIIMEVINQILSSPKLAKILQKLLAIGKVMMEPNGIGSSAANKIKPKTSATDAKMTVLEQLLQVSNTKGVDKKTSLLDYMVKSLYDKNEENLLEVIDDLTQLSDNTLPLSTTEALNEYDNLQKQLSSLQREMERVQPSNNIFSSPTAKAMSDDYCVALEKHIISSRERITYINKRKVLLTKKIRALMEYFGEDPKNTDNTAIFHALKEFRRALAFSKEAVEWKLSRSQQV